MMLDIKDAVKVAMYYIENHCDDYDVDEDDELLLYQEMEQKCVISDMEDEPVKNVISLITDVNPKEICKQIEQDNLMNWCINIQTEMELNLIHMKGVEK